LTRPSRLSTTAVYSALASERSGRECERSLRVTCGRRFIGDQLDAGIDVVTVQQMAGHAKASTTTGYDRGDERANAHTAPERTCGTVTGPPPIWADLPPTTCSTQDHPGHILGVGQQVAGNV
jgi:hypothetical protein